MSYCITGEERQRASVFYSYLQLCGNFFFFRGVVREEKRYCNDRYSGRNSTDWSFLEAFLYLFILVRVGESMVVGGGKNEMILSMKSPGLVNCTTVHNNIGAKTPYNFVLMFKGGRCACAGEVLF